MDEIRKNVSDAAARRRLLSEIARVRDLVIRHDRCVDIYREEPVEQAVAEYHRARAARDDAAARLARLVADAAAGGRR